MPELKPVKPKVLLVGDEVAMKTDLVRPYVVGQFDDTCIQTFGAKVVKKAVWVIAPDGTTPLQVDLMVWDILGYRNFIGLRSEPFFHDTKAILAVCDATKETSLDNLKNWIWGVYSVVGEVPTYILVRAEGPGEMKFGREEVAALARPFKASFGLVPPNPDAAREVVEFAFTWLAESIVGTPLDTRRAKPATGKPEPVRPASELEKQTLPRPTETPWEIFREFLPTAENRLAGAEPPEDPRDLARRYRENLPEKGAEFLDATENRDFVLMPVLDGHELQGVKQTWQLASWEIHFEPLDWNSLYVDSDALLASENQRFFDSEIAALAALKKEFERRRHQGHEVMWLVPKGGL